MITRRQAEKICRRERLSWDLLQAGESLLLRTGAKLWKRMRRYWVGGYTPDGRDIKPYEV